MIKILTLLFAIVFLFQSCENKKDTKLTNKLQNGVKGTNENVQVDLIEKTVEYSIDVKPIDSVQYQLQKAKSRYKQAEIEKITDFETAKKKLKNVVFFNDNDEDGETQAILKIRFKNGKESIINDYYYFVAYYPTEDILLCEGGHTTDVSFNLRNGKETEEIGNPAYIKTSPNKLFRLNGHFGGQECSSYFIQKKANNEFEKIIQLDKEFEKQTKIWLCIVGNSFWQDETTLYLTEESDYTENGLNKRYFKIKLIER
jgi:hypothetical protein